MSEPEDAEEEETLPEELELSTFGALMNDLIKGIISIARQFLCFCSVMIFPALSIFYEKAPTDFPQIYIINEGDSNEVKEEKNTLNWNPFNNTLIIVSTIGYIISGISLSLIGRKNTVIVANLLHLAILIHSYTQNKEFLPYPLTLVHTFIKEFALVPFFIYVAEITSPNIRVFFSGLYYFIDVLFGIKVDKTIIQHEVHGMFLNCAIATSFSLLLALFVPETPFWQALKGNPEKAEETFLWLRANQSNISSEFDQMMASAENLMENRAKKILQYLTSLTFVLGAMFSCFIALCSFEPCPVMQVLLNDFYVPRDEWIEPTDYEELCLLIRYVPCTHAANSAKERVAKYTKKAVRFPAVTIFLFLCFLIPRKVLFLVSYALGIFIINMITWKLASLRTMIQISSTCYSPPYLGVIPLSMILPVEIYPTALREIGAVISATLLRAVKLLLISTRVKSRINFPTAFIAPTISYICYFGSLIGILFILLFMPETWGTSIYESNELTLSLTFRSRRKSIEGSIIEDAEEEGDESAMGAGESTVKE